MNNVVVARTIQSSILFQSFPRLALGADAGRQSNTRWNHRQLNPFSRIAKIADASPTALDRYQFYAYTDMTSVVDNKKQLTVLGMTSALRNLQFRP